MLSRQSTPECTQLKGKINVFPGKLLAAEWMDVFIEDLWDCALECGIIGINSRWAGLSFSKLP